MTLERTMWTALALTIGIASLGSATASAQEVGTARHLSSALASPRGEASPPTLSDLRREFPELAEHGISARRLTPAQRQELWAIASDANLGSALLAGGIVMIVLGALTGVTTMIVGLTSTADRLGRAVDCAISRCSSSAESNDSSVLVLGVMAGVLGATGVALTVAGAITRGLAGGRRRESVRALSIDLSLAPLPAGATAGLSITF